MNSNRTILVTGGAGYVGAVLVPMLLEHGWRVRVLDLFLYGDDVFSELAAHEGLTQIKGDIRDLDTLGQALDGCTHVLHLACISNDPSFELNPALGKSINLDAFEPLVRLSKARGVERFIYISSSSVYGVSDAPSVTEQHPLNPLTDYSRFKAECEPILLSEQSDSFTTLVIRPATVCGYSPRQRLDLTVNILTTHAFFNRRITVFGGEQKRPHIHLRDLCRYYCELLEMDKSRIAGRIYNAGYQNNPVRELAEIVRAETTKVLGGEQIEIVTTPTNDPRSYHICSDKIENELGLRPALRIEDAVQELLSAFRQGLLPDPFDNDLYYNVKLMKRKELH